MGRRTTTAAVLWRPRFSLRSLFVVVTLVCIYLGGWEITKAWVVDDLTGDPNLRGETPVPYVVIIDDLDRPNLRYVRRYHLCCLGFMVRLPFARACRDRHPLIMGGVIPRIIIQEEEEKRLGIAVW